MKTDDRRVLSFLEFEYAALFERSSRGVGYTAVPILDFQSIIENACLLLFLYFLYDQFSLSQFKCIQLLFRVFEDEFKFSSGLVLLKSYKKFKYV